MRLSKIKVDNFKSLVDVEIELAKFTCLVGLNGSGKSTVLQFVDFLSQLVRGEVRDWLKQRNWKAIDLVAWRPASTPITFTVELSISETSFALLARWNYCRPVLSVSGQMHRRRQSVEAEKGCRHIGLICR